MGWVRVLKTYIPLSHTFTVRWKSQTERTKDEGRSQLSMQTLVLTPLVDACSQPILD